MGTALAAAAIAAILFFGVLFWSSAPRAVAGLADAGRTAVSVVKDPAKRAQAAATATVEPIEDAAAWSEDTATQAGDATVQAIKDASETLRETVAQTVQDAAEAAPSWDTVQEAAAERVETVGDVVTESAAEAARSAGEAVLEATAEVTPDAVKDTAAEKLQQAAEKLAQAAEKLEALAARLELTASPSEETDAPEAEPAEAAGPARGQGRGPGPADARPADARRAEPAPSQSRSAGSSTASMLAASGRAPWVLMPQPKPATRVPAGPLVVEARGRGDAPIARIRLVLDGAALPVTLEQRGDAVWRAQAATSVAPGRHVVDAIVDDAAGRTGSYRWQFTAAP